MKVKKLPFNVQLLDNSRERLGGLLPVLDLDIYDAAGAFNPRGLYSNIIFGEVGTKERSTRHGYIPLKTAIIHPKILEELYTLNKVYRGLMMGKSYAIWDNKTKNFIASDIIEGETGMAFFMEHWKDIKHKETKSQKRSLRIQFIEKYKHIAEISYFVVLPAGLRELQEDETGRAIEDDINTLYRKILVSVNTIPDSLKGKNDPVIDSSRWLMQSAVVAVYKALLLMIEGKKGFLQFKWGSRKTAHGTRNIISTMDPGASDITSPRAFDNTTTLVGLYQTLKGVEPLVVDWLMPNSPVSNNLIENINYEIDVVDTKTLKALSISVSETIRSKWGTESGRSDLMTKLADAENRYNPIMIDGYYFKLIYKDDKYFKIFNGIEELPDGWDVNKVTPLTWAEYTYHLIAPAIKDIRVFITRYPVTGEESIYASKPYLKTTVETITLKELNDDWFPIDEEIFIEWPLVANKTAFIDTTSPHSSMLIGLNADFDGDVVNVVYVFSEDAVNEVDRLLYTPDNFLDATGGMVQKSSDGANPILNRVLTNFTGFPLS